MTVSKSDSPTRDLTRASIKVLIDGQAASGAYVASPSFEQYRFGWLRDGSYCALAMDAAGERSSSADFHHWVMGVLHRHSSHIAETVRRARAGEPFDERTLLPTRFELDGRAESEDGPDDWPNFQLDGYGTWLFAFMRHRRGDGSSLSERERGAVRLAAEYLAATWTVPCFDYWEEFGDRQHTATLASIAAGLRAAALLLHDDQLAATANIVMGDIEARCVDGRRFVKGPHDARVDASLLSLATPFDLLSVDDPRMVATAEAIDEQLTTESGGVRRYVGDEYYGGSPWLLLTAWRGWHARRAGDQETYERSRAWVRAAAGPGGDMPEQRVDEPQLPEFVGEWEARWGRVADPLLWSHAKYLLMELECDAAAGDRT